MNYQAYVNLRLADPEYKRSKQPIKYSEEGVADLWSIHSLELEENIFTLAISDAAAQPQWGMSGAQLRALWRRDK